HLELRGRVLDLAQVGLRVTAHRLSLLRIGAAARAHRPVPRCRIVANRPAGSPAGPLWYTGAMSEDALRAVTPELRALRDRYAAFMDDHVYPHEAAFAADDEAADALIAEVRARARSAGLWAPHIGPEAG